MELRDFLIKEGLFSDFKDAISGRASTTPLSIGEYCQENAINPRAFLDAFCLRDHAMASGQPLRKVWNSHLKWGAYCNAQGHY